MTGEEILEAQLRDAHEDTWDGEAPALDPASIIAIISAIFEGIRLCRSPDAASRQIKRGGAIAKSKLRKMLKKENYPKQKRNDLAKKLAERGRDLTEAEVQAILDDAQDLPEPSPPPSGFPVWAVVPFLLSMWLASPAMAGGFPVSEALMSVSDPFPVDVPTARETRIILEVSDNCPPCEAVKKHQLKELEASGWTVGDGDWNHVQVVNVTGTDHGPTPTWNLIHHGKEFAELEGSGHKSEYVAEWFNTFVECGKVLQPTEEEKTKAPPKTLGRAGVPSGGNWVYYGSGSLGGHLVRVHGYAWEEVRGLSHGQLVFLHSYAHNHGRPYRASAAAKVRTVRRSTYCPTCPR